MVFEKFYQLLLSTYQAFRKGISNKDYDMKPIDLTPLLKDYQNKDLHIAVTQDYSKVVGTGKTIEEAINEALKKGYKNPIILRAPDDTLGSRL